jgi:hypothetical protein
MGYSVLNAAEYLVGRVRKRRLRLHHSTFERKGVAEYVTSAPWQRCAPPAR